MPGSTGGSWKRSDWSGSPKWDNPTGNRGHQGFWTYRQNHATAPVPDPTQVEDLENRFATPPAPIVEKVSTTRIAHRSFGSRRPAADGGTARKGSAQCPLAHRVPPYAPTMSDGLSLDAPRELV